MLKWRHIDAFPSMLTIPCSEAMPGLCREQLSCELVCAISTELVVKTDTTGSGACAKPHRHISAAVARDRRVWTRKATLEIADLLCDIVYRFRHWYRFRLRLWAWTSAEGWGGTGRVITSMSLEFESDDLICCSSSALALNICIFKFSLKAWTHLRKWTRFYRQL